MARIGTIEVEVTLAVAAEVTEAMATALDRILYEYAAGTSTPGVCLQIERNRIVEIIQEEIHRELNAPKGKDTD